MKIAFLGDIALFGKFSVGNKDVFNYFYDVSTKLNEFDYVIGNLETPLYNGNRTYGAKSANIKADERNIELLKYLNINVVNLANNHIYDYGIDGFKKTRYLLDKYGIGYFGVNNIQHRIVNYEEGVKLAFNGFCCYSTNGVGYLTNGILDGVNELNAFRVEKIMLKNHRDGYLNIASFHAGEEHVNYPNYDHIIMARKLAQKVPYVYYGHHPHVMQGMEKIGESLIAYSLGNFCFDDVYIDISNGPLIKQSVENRKSFILSLDITNNKVSNYGIIPIFSGDTMFEVGKDSTIKEEIDKYSGYLYYDKKRYIRERTTLRNDYIARRKSARNLEWYLRRMKINTLIMLINAIKNWNKYKKMVQMYSYEDE
ncbi:MAG: CapA family protein [Vulcanibacillus sp.]